MTSSHARTHSAPSAARPWRVVIVVALAAFALALAQQGPLEVALERFQVVETTVDGETREELRSAFELEPGDLVEEVLQVRNTSDADLREIALVLPVPDGTRYLEDSAAALELAGERATPEFSYDGGVEYGLPPLTREVVTEENGRQVVTEVPVPPEAYTHARWVLPILEAQTTATARLRAAVQ